MAVTDVKGLKVAHFAAFGPGRSGQYATVKDLILAERRFGIDAQFIDCVVCSTCRKNEGCEGKTDGKIVTQSMDWATNADIFVRHSVIPHELESMGKPIILCLHGRPENSFLLEKYKQMPILSFMREVAADEKYKALVTFWEEHLNFFKNFLPEKPMTFVPAMVDLEQYNPEGPKRDYSTRKGHPNIMIADMWREDTTPFNVLFAAVEFIEKYCPTGRIHLYGVPSDKRSPIHKIVQQLSAKGYLGDVCTLMPEMAEQYRAADFLVTPHVISTRVIREAMACGLPVVAGGGNPYTNFTCDPRNIKNFADEINRAWKCVKETPGGMRGHYRQLAEDNFDMDAAGKAMAGVFDSVIQKEKEIKTRNEKLDENITFAFSAYGDKFIDNVFTLLQSIDSIYDGKANVIFYYHNIDKGYIDEIEKILPYVILKESKHAGCESGDKEYKTAQKGIIWKEILEDHPALENVVLMDADMMLVRKVGKFFSENFDIGFCYKEGDDENVQWPVNGGIMLVKNSPLVRQFLGEWANLTIETQKAGEPAKRDGYTLWGGGDQVSLGYIFATRDTSVYKKGFTVSNVSFKGFPMKYLNESRGIIPDDKTHIIHYKGDSWQNLLRTGVFSKRRPSMTCKTLYKLNRSVLSKWQERRRTMLGKWSPDFEMEYWNNHDDEFYIDDIRRVYNAFEVDKIIVENMDTLSIKTVMEVGGGAYGGALRFFPFTSEKYSIDLAMDKFLEKGKVPLGMNCIKSDFANLPFNDSVADVVFAWEVLDHALTPNHFDKGVAELCRIMKPGALLFFNHPLHDKPKPGHTVIKTSEDIFTAFRSKGLQIIFNLNIANTMKREPEKHKELCVVFSKPQVMRKAPCNVTELISKIGD